MKGEKYRLVVLVFAALFLVSVMSAGIATAAPDFDDDLNGDGIVNIFDIIMALNGNANVIKDNKGDTNYDRRVDIHDLAAIGLAFGSEPSDPNWNPNADIANAVNKIDILDLAMVGTNFNTVYDPPQSDCTNISIETPSVDIYKDDNFTVNVSINTDGSVFAGEFTLYFNPSILSAISVDEGDFLSQDGTNTSMQMCKLGVLPELCPKIDNTAGKIVFANTRVGKNKPGVNGTGVLASVTFNAKSGGTSILDLENVTLSDHNLLLVPDVSVTDGIVDVMVTKPSVINQVTDDSSAGNPTNVGSDVTFTVNWSDEDSTLARIYVCDSANIDSAGCHNREFCSTSNAVTNPVSCQYTAQETDAHVESYWVKVCDDSNTCSDVSDEYTFYVNHAPDISGIPDEAVPENGPAQDNWIDLWNYASDPEYAVNQLIFSITGQSNQNLISCSVDSNRYIDCAAPAADQEGFSDVTVQATDPGGLSDTDTFRITVYHVNQPPQIDSYYPLTDPTITEEESQEFSITKSDPDNDTLTVQWYLDSNPLPGETGDSYTYVADYDSAGTHNVLVEVSDSINTTSHEWTLTVTNVNRAPVANANDPYTGNEGSPITFNGSGSYDPDGDIITYKWDLDDDGQYDDATGVNPQYTWNDDYSGTIELRVSDGTLSDTDSTTVTVNNVPPTAPGIDVVPDVAYTTDDLVCEVIEESYDPADDITYSYAWYKDNNVLQGAQTTNTVSNTLTTKGETWKCEVIPHDGTENGPADEDSVVIQNSAPSIDSYSPLTDPTIDEGQSQAFSITKSDADGDPLTTTWYVDGSLVASSTDSYTFDTIHDSQGTYTVKAEVSDGSLTDSHTWTLTVRDTCTRIQLAAGNNMFSLPRNQQKTFNQLNTDCNIVFENGRYDLAYYKPNTENITNSSNYVFTGLDDILYPGQGYFVKFSGNCYIQMCDGVVGTGDLGYLGTKQVKEGWNMVGAPTYQTNFNAGTCQLFGGVGIMKYAYDVSGCTSDKDCCQKFVEGYNGGYAYCNEQWGIKRCRCGVDYFEPGLGYWLRTENECSLG